MAPIVIRKIQRQSALVRAASPALLIVLLAMVTAAPAQPPDLSKVYTSRQALVIGINRYMDWPDRTRRWPELFYAEDDAKRVGKALTSLGFTVRHLLGPQATRQGIVDGLKALRGLKPGDQVLVFFSGHGDTPTRDRQSGYLIPFDADRADTIGTALSMDVLRDQANVLPAQQVMFVIDACFAGNLFRTRDTPSTPRTPADWEALTKTRVRFALTAGVAGQQAAEAGKAGLLTEQFLKAIENFDQWYPDGVVTARRLSERVREAVRDIAKNKQGREQTPDWGYLEGQTDGDFLLTVRPSKMRTGSLVIRSRETVDLTLAGQPIGRAGPGKDLLVENLVSGSHGLVAQPQRVGLRRWEKVVQVVADQRADVIIDFGTPPVIRDEQGREMVLVPAGEFTMGSTQEEVNRAIEECKRDGSTDDECKAWMTPELPVHRVWLDAFYLDRYEVTNTLFEHFVRETEHETRAEIKGRSWVWYRKDGKSQLSSRPGADWRKPNGPGNSALRDHPVVQVAWDDALAYCRWAGKRLPTEAEWEKAARGTEVRRYPWGDAWDESRVGEWKNARTHAVGSATAGASPYGAHDMAGNVWEWVADYGASYQPGPNRNPQGPASSQFRVTRGGSWESAPFSLRATYRNFGMPDGQSNLIGFRCARGA